MNLNKTFGRVATTLVAATMLASVTAVPAFANDKTDDIQFVKVLDMNAATGASVPNATYTYTVTGAGVTGTADPKLPIMSGSEASNVTVTIDSAVFSSNDIDGDTANGDADGVKNGKITKKLTVNFSGDYTKPGIYRYQVTESDPTDQNADLTFTDAADNTFYMDVYVERTADGMKVTNTVFMKAQTMPTFDGTPDPDEADYGAGKIYEDVDTYNTYTLTITKKVEGTLANAGATYDFNVDFTAGMPAGTMVTVGDAMDTDDVAASGALLVDGKISIVPGEDGSSVVISGIPSTAVYRVIENLDDTLGYTVSATVNGEAVTVTSNADENTYTTDSVNLKGESDNTVSDTVVITNTRNAVSPTGIVMNVAPYVLLVVVAAAGCFVFLRKRRED